MKKPATQPRSTTNESYGGDHETITEHPAFGCLQLRRLSCSPGVRLFGSELLHREVMHITVTQAKQMRRLNHDRLDEGSRVCEFTLSLAQWAAFISSAGAGGGTPCTLDTHQSGPLVNLPEIDAPAEQHVDKFKREMQESVERRLAGINAALEKLETSGKCTGAAREALADAKREASYLAGTVDFVNRQFVDATEHVVASAKTEIEGFVTGLAIRTGITQLRGAAPVLQIGGHSPIVEES